MCISLLTTYGRKTAITIFISVANSAANSAVITVAYIWLFLLPTLYSLGLQQATQYVLVHYPFYHPTSPIISGHYYFKITNATSNM